MWNVSRGFVVAVAAVMVAVSVSACGSARWSSEVEGQGNSSEQASPTVSGSVSGGDSSRSAGGSSSAKSFSSSPSPYSSFSAGSSSAGVSSAAYCVPVRRMQKFSAVLASSTETSATAADIAAAKDMLSAMQDAVPPLVNAGYSDYAAYLTTASVQVQYLVNNPNVDAWSEGQRKNYALLAAASSAAIQNRKNIVSEQAQVYSICDIHDGVVNPS